MHDFSLVCSGNTQAIDIPLQSGDQSGQGAITPETAEALLNAIPEEKNNCTLKFGDAFVSTPAQLKQYVSTVSATNTPASPSRSLEFLARTELGSLGFEPDKAEELGVKETEGKFFALLAGLGIPLSEVFFLDVLGGAQRSDHSFLFTNASGAEARSEAKATWGYAIGADLGLRLFENFRLKGGLRYAKNSLETIDGDRLGRSGYLDPQKTLAFPSQNGNIGSTSLKLEASYALGPIEFGAAYLRTWMSVHQENTPPVEGGLNQFMGFVAFRTDFDSSDVGRQKSPPPPFRFERVSSQTPPPPQAPVPQPPVTQTLPPSAPKKAQINEVELSDISDKDRNPKTTLGFNAVSANGKIEITGFKKEGEAEVEVKKRGRKSLLFKTIKADPEDISGDGKKEIKLSLGNQLPQGNYTLTFKIGLADGKEILGEAKLTSQHKPVLKATAQALFKEDDKGVVKVKLTLTDIPEDGKLLIKAPGLDLKTKDLDIKKGKKEYTIELNRAPVAKKYTLELSLTKDSSEIAAPAKPEFVVASRTEAAPPAPPTPPPAPVVPAPATPAPVATRSSWISEAEETWFNKTGGLSPVASYSQERDTVTIKLRKPGLTPDQILANVVPYDTSIHPSVVTLSMDCSYKGSKYFLTMTHNVFDYPVVTKYTVAKDQNSIKMKWKQVPLEEAVAVLNTNKIKLQQKMTEAKINMPVDDYIKNIVVGGGTGAFDRVLGHIYNRLADVEGHHYYDARSGYYEFEQKVAFRDTSDRVTVHKVGEGKTVGAALKTAYRTIAEPGKGGKRGQKGEEVRSMSGKNCQAIE